MPLPIAPTIIKVSLFATLNDQPIMNRVHIKVGATNPTAADCQTIATNVATWWDGNVKDLVGPDYVLREVHAQSLAEVNGPQATYTLGLPQPGTLVGATLPGNVAFCVSLRTGLTGRSARGRFYWAGLVEQQVAKNIVDAGVVISIVAAMNNLISLITSLSAQVVIVSYYSGNVLRPGGPVYFIVTNALAVDSNVDSQRGRLR